MSYIDNIVQRPTGSVSEQMIGSDWLNSEQSTGVSFYKLYISRLQWHCKVEMLDKYKIFVKFLASVNEYNIK